MKKIFGLMMIAAVVIFAAGQANATFSAGDLIAVSYDTSTNIEVAQDLGSIASLSTGTTTSSIPLSDFGAGQSWSNVSTVYFADSALNTTPSAGTPIQLWIAAGSTPTVGLHKAGSLNTGIGSDVIPEYQGLYNTLGTYPVVISNATNFANAFLNIFGAAGTYGGGINVNGSVNDGTSTNQNLYTGTFTTGSNSATALTLVPNFGINTNAGATTITGAQAVPIPPSVLLMGSGLLGLIGIGRKKILG